MELMPAIGMPQTYPKIVEWSKDPKNGQFFRRMGPHYTWNSKDMLDGMLQNSFFIIDSEAEVVGLATIVTFDQHNRRAEFGLLVDIEDGSERNSVAREVVLELQNYIFGALGYNKIQCVLLEGRQKLGNSLLELGFKVESTLKDNTFYNGMYHTEIGWYRLKKDWDKEQD